MVELKQRPDGVSLPVKVQPGARRNAITGEHAGALKVAVNAAPEQGKANEAVIDLLADLLLHPRNCFSLLSGATNRQKQFLVTNIEVTELHERLKNLLTQNAAKKSGK